MEKIGCPPRTPPSRKSLLYIFLFYPLIQVNTSIKLLIRINTYNSPYSKNAKRKSGYIKNKNGGVLGKGERERDNRFYKIGFPLAVKIISEGETAFRKNRLSPSDSPFPKIFAFYYIVLSAYSGLC